MNKAIMDSIEWHKDQIFKLLEDDDLYKEEGDIYSVKADLNEIIEKAKSKKRVWVKATATKKGHYREMEVGRKEEVGGKQKGKWSSELNSEAENAIDKASDIAEETMKTAKAAMEDAKSAESSNSKDAAWRASASAEAASMAASGAEDAMNRSAKYSKLAYAAGNNSVGDMCDAAASGAEDAMHYASKAAADASAIAAKIDPSYKDEAKTYAEGYRNVLSG